MKRFASTEDIRVPLTFPTPADGVALVKASEAAFDAQLDAAAAAIVADCLEHGVRILRLSGPTCAGKTTTAAKLTAVLEAAGRVVYPVSLDDFFYDRAVLLAMSEETESGELDYDSVKTIDLPTLSACVHALVEQGRADIPVFDFISGDRMGTRELSVPAGVEPVFLFEGIQAVYPEVAALFEGMPQRSIFINVLRPTTVYDEAGNERIFAPETIRLYRRLVRDEAKRGACPDFTLELWRSVRANEVTSILPYADVCDYGIDSNMLFDIHMLAPHLRRIFHEKPCDGPEVSTSEAILASLAGIEAIPDACIADNSLYHEFILR